MATGKISLHTAVPRRRTGGEQRDFFSPDIVSPRSAGDTVPGISDLTRLLPVVFPAFGGEYNGQFSDMLAGAQYPGVSA